MQVEVPCRSAHDLTVRTDNCLQRGHVLGAERLVDLGNDVPGPLQFKSGSVDKGPEFPWIGFDDENIVGVDDLIAGWSAIYSAPSKETRNYDVLLGQLLEVAHESSYVP